MLNLRLHAGLIPPDPGSQEKAREWYRLDSISFEIWPYRRGKGVEKPGSRFHGSGSIVAERLQDMIQQGVDFIA